jgi:predicted ATP-dependent endonuclease of OLD family
VSPDDLVKGLVDHRIFDSDLGLCQESKCYGQGFQRHLIFVLIRLAAKYTSEKPTPTRKEFAPEMSVILFEEPEAFLHPAQIAVLDRSIRTLTKSPGTQVLISTHNPLFVSRSIEDLPSLTRLHRHGPKARPYRVSQEELDKIIYSNQDALKGWVASGISVSEDDLTSEMETLKYSLWLDSRRCAGFFANRILLVEGQTEVALFDYLINSGRIKVPREGVFVFDSLGKFNIHRFMNLFASLGIQHSVLYDDDNGKNAIVSSTIQNAKNGFTIGIDSFPKDIEDFLGIPPADKPHKKPQHVMYQVAQEKVSTDRIDELCKKIAKVLSLDNG